MLKLQYQNNNAESAVNTSRHLTNTLTDKELIAMAINTHTCKKQKPQEKLTQKELKELLHYDPKTGVFTWIVKRNGVKKSKIAGSESKYGYLRIRVNGKKYCANRLAWLYMEGYIPVGFDVDHKNRIRNNNKWKNLRIISRSCNAINSKIPTTNKTGVVGVYLDKQRNQWRSSIRINGKRINLGRFKKFEDAVYSRWQAEIKYGFSNCKSTSSAFQYLKKYNCI